ncbi:MAG TPA: hypothetical protein ENF37_02435 [Beggiatoa sp.]|nr:hypothetical protein [Beggiatoa sp.]
MSVTVQMEQVEPVLQPQAAEFALESNPHSLAAMVLLFTFIGYGLLDFLINQETYAQRALYEIYLGGGVVIAIVVMLWLLAAKLPKLESIMIGCFVGCAVGAALYPGLLRINQLTDTTCLQTYQYVLQKDYALKPLKDETLPTLFFKSDLDSWSHFELKSIHDIQLRKGGLAFYQINMAPIYADMRQYFKNARNS